MLLSCVEEDLIEMIKETIPNSVLFSSVAYDYCHMDVYVFLAQYACMHAYSTEHRSLV